MTALRSFIFLVLAPGMVAGYIPLALLREGPKIETGLLAYLALPLWVMGVAALLWCFWDFLSKGGGTPAPIDPPRALVVGGLYRYVRNPMYVAVFMIILGHFLWFKSVWLIAYALVVWLAFYLFVLGYEEPHLKKTFGATYEQYCRNVPRWMPRIGR